MDWQKEFDDTLNECAVAISKIMPIADEFVKYEDSHGLFDSYLLIKGGKDSNYNPNSTANILGPICFFGMLGALPGVVLYNFTESFTIVIAIAIVGVVIGVICGILFARHNRGKLEVYVSGSAYNQDVTDETVKYIMKKKNIKENVARAIVEEQKRLIEAQDSLIKGEWRNAFGKLEQLFDSASGTHVLKNNEDFSKMQEFDTLFSSLTFEGRQEYASAVALEKEIQTMTRVAVGIFAVATVVGLAATGASKNYWDNAYPDKKRF